MSTDAQFIPPKKKPTVFWWVGGAFFVLLLVFFIQLLTPSPPIAISPQTTHITSPLRPDGVPDYEKYLLELYRKDVTPESNAAALIWPTLWPSELDPSQYAAVAKELGLKSIPLQEDALVDIHKMIRLLAEAQQKSDPPPAADPSQPTSEEPGDAPGEEGDAMFGFVTSQPWTAAQLPAFAQWAHDNQHQLDTLVEASHRTHCYFPSPSLLDGQDHAVSSILLPGIQAVRLGTNSLSARAMLELGENHLIEAWHDLLAANRIGHLVAQGQTMVEELVGISISNDACNKTQTFLHEAKLSPDEARQILRDLNTLEYFDSLADSLDHLERTSFDDAVIRLSRGDEDNPLSMNFADSNNQPNNLQYVRYFHVNWNVVLRQGNEYYDRLVAAARMKNPAARDQAIAQVERDLTSARQDIDPGSLVAAAINPNARDRVIATTAISMYLPAVQAAIGAQDRAHTQLDLTRLAAALAVYRAEHNAYPKKLEELVPSVLDQPSVDVYNAKPYLYKLKDDGYVLYSVGDNGQDDGGSNATFGIFEGRDIPGNSDSQEDIADRDKIKSTADDIAIRLPRKRIPVPKNAVIETPTAVSK